MWVVSFMSTPSIGLVGRKRDVSRQQKKDKGKWLKFLRNINENWNGRKYIMYLCVLNSQRIMFWTVWRTVSSEQLSQLQILLHYT